MNRSEIETKKRKIEALAAEMGWHGDIFSWNGITEKDWQKDPRYGKTLTIETLSEEAGNELRPLDSETPDVEETLLRAGLNRVALLSCTDWKVVRGPQEFGCGDGLKSPEEGWAHEVSHQQESVKFGIRSLIIQFTTGKGQKGRALIQNLIDLRECVERGENLAYILGRVLAAPSFTDSSPYPGEEEKAAWMLLTAKHQGVELNAEEINFLRKVLPDNLKHLLTD